MVNGSCFTNWQQIKSRAYKMYIDDFDTFWSVFVCPDGYTRDENLLLYTSSFNWICRHTLQFSNSLCYMSNAEHTSSHRMNPTKINEFEGNACKFLEKNTIHTNHHNESTHIHIQTYHAERWYEINVIYEWLPCSRFNKSKKPTKTSKFWINNIMKRKTANKMHALEFMLWTSVKMHDAQII